MSVDANSTLSFSVMRWGLLITLSVLNTTLLVCGLRVWQMLLVDAALLVCWMVVRAARHHAPPQFDAVSQQSRSSSLHYAASAVEVLAIRHPHVGRVSRSHGWDTLLGILFSRTFKAEEFNTQTDGKWESVAIRAGCAPDLFLLTVGRRFVLVTMKDGGKRTPIVHKRWTRQARDTPPPYLSGIAPVEDTYMDEEGLEWKHSYGGIVGNELVAFDADGLESVRFSLE